MIFKAQFIKSLHNIRNLANFCLFYDANLSDLQIFSNKTLDTGSISMRYSHQVKQYYNEL